MEKHAKEISSLTQGSILGQIILFALPIILGNLLQELYSVADTIIVGQTLGNIKLAAVGSTGALSYLAVGFVVGLTGGCTVLTAHAYGAQDRVALKKSVAAHLLIAAVAVVLLTAVFVGCAASMLRLLHTTDATFQYALAYITIIYAGLPATMLYNLTAALFRSVGDSKTPLILLIFSSLLNVGLDFLFILAFHWDVRGAATATVLSQLLSGLLCCILLKRNATFLLPDRKSWKGIGHVIREELRVGVPMGLQSSVIAIGMMALQFFVNSFGDAAVSAYTIGNRLQILMQSPLFSMSVVMATFVGQNAGAGRYDRIRRGVRQSAAIFAVLGIVIGMGVLLFSTQLICLFTSATETNTIALAKNYLTWACPMEWSLALLFIYRGALQGLRDGFTPMIGSFLEVGMRVLFPALLCAVLGFTAISLAGPAAWTVSAALMPIVYARKMRKERMSENDRA